MSMDSQHGPDGHTRAAYAALVKAFAAADDDDIGKSQAYVNIAQTHCNLYKARVEVDDSTYKRTAQTVQGDFFDEIPHGQSSRKLS